MLFDLRRRATQLRPKQCANSSGERHTPEIVALDQDGLPLSCAAKSCLGTGLSTLERWLGDGKANVLLLQNVPGSPMSPLLDAPPSENSARTRTDSTMTAGAFRGTDGSNPASSANQWGSRRDKPGVGRNSAHPSASRPISATPFAALIPRIAGGASCFWNAGTPAKCPLAFLRWARTRSRSSARSVSPGLTCSAFPSAAWSRRRSHCRPPTWCVS